MGSPDATPVSAGRLADLLGDALPAIDTVPAVAFTLVERVRELVEAVVMTDLDEDALGRAAEEVAAVTEALRSRRRDAPLRLVRHPDGRVESLLQAGSGRLNPQAAPVRWTVRPTEPPPGSPPRPVECVATCAFGAAHAGSPGRAHGGMVAAVLDECLGVAARAAGASGMTVALHVNLRAAAPLGRPVEIRARVTEVEGRKTWVAGEMLDGGTTVADATILCVAERSA